MQAYFNNRRNNQPLNDGFSITDSSQGTVVAVDGQSRAGYDKMIKDNFKYTQDNYQEAYKEAARTGKPIVAVFGGFEHNNSRQLIENSLPNAKSGAAKDAIYIYVDRAKTKDPELARFADSQFAGGHNAAVSIVFSVKPGQDGSLQPEAPVMRWQGADHSMISSFNGAIAATKEKQESYKGQFNPTALLEKSDKSDTSDRTERSDKPGGSFEIARSAITREITAASQAEDWHDGERHYRAAMKAADSVTPADIKAEQERIAKAVATTPQNSAEFQKLVQAQANLTFVSNAKAATRADLGLACLRWSETQTDENLKQRFRDIGSQWIDSAGLRNPAIYSNPELHKRLAATGIPADELQKLLPLLKPAEGTNQQRDLFKYGGDGKNSDSPPPTVTPKIEPQEKSDVELAKAREAAKAKDIARAKIEADAKAKEESDAKKAAKFAAFKKIEEEDLNKAVATPEEYYAALKDAADRGLPVIIKIGQKGCPPCAAMAPALKEAEESLKGKAVVIRVRADLDETTQLAMDLGAGEGVPITKFAKPVPWDRAHQGLKELIPERHEGFTSREKEGFTANDEPNTLEYFIAAGFREWKRTTATKR